MQTRSQLCSNCAQEAVELGKSNATRTSRFAKNVSVQDGLATATNPLSG